MELRNFLDKADAPVLIDQEGGRVLRLDRRISAGLSTRRGLRRPRAGLGGRAAGLPPDRGRGWRVYFRVRIQNESTQITPRRSVLR